MKLLLFLVFFAYLAFPICETNVTENHKKIRNKIALIKRNKAARSHRASLHIRKIRNSIGREVQGRKDAYHVPKPLKHVELFPFTQFGPNVQLLGLLQTLSVCSMLNINCLKPGFSSLFGESFYRLDDLFDVSKLPLKNNRHQVLQPDVFIATKRNGIVCWPAKVYFQMHNISYFENPLKPSYDTKVIVLQPENYETSLLKTLADVDRPLSSNVTVALVYCGVGVGFPEPEHAAWSARFRALRKSLRPAQSLERKSQELKYDLFGPEEYIALHVRLRDHCTVSFQACCCETSGSWNRLSERDVERDIALVQAKYNLRYVFVAAPPSFQKMRGTWKWAQSESVKMYTSEEEDSIVVSMIQQLICARAKVFLVTVPRSTWTISVSSWNIGGQITRKITANQAISLPEITQTSDYLPHEPLEVPEIPEIALNSRSVCSTHNTTFVMLRNDGFGASVHFMLVALGHAIRNGQAIVPLTISTHNKWVWGGCPALNFECMFQKMHNCANDAQFAALVQRVQSSWHEYRSSHPCATPNCFSWGRIPFFDLPSQALSREMQWPILGLNSTQQAGIYRGKLLEILLKVKKDTWAEILTSTIVQHNSFEGDSHISVLDFFKTFQQPMVGLHIRRGDACKDPRRIRDCYPVEKYLASVDRIASIYNVSSIYVSTDGEDVIESVKRSTSLTLYSQLVDRKKYFFIRNYNEENMVLKMRHSPAGKKRNIVMSNLVDLFAMRKGAYFVGTFSSDFGRMSYELMAARLGASPPHISLDIPFCYSSEIKKNLRSRMPSHFVWSCL
ncbi:glycosyltransferase family 23 protein [Pseudoscourfieldia marina]